MICDLLQALTSGNEGGSMHQNEVKDYCRKGKVPFGKRGAKQLHFNFSTKNRGSSRLKRTRCRSLRRFLPKMRRIDLKPKVSRIDPRNIKRLYHLKIIEIPQSLPPSE